MQSTVNSVERAPRAVGTETVVAVLAAISFCHLLNDLVQSLIPAIYPLLKQSYRLNFAQVGLITFTFQLTASLLQPLIGMYADRKPVPYSLPIGMAFTLVGLLVLSVAPTYALILAAAALVGLGSATFHPESSRVARAASGGRHGLAQAVFQVGGNAGSAVGPLLAAYAVHEQSNVAWFSLAALLAIGLLLRVSRWSKRHHAAQARAGVATPVRDSTLSRRQVKFALFILMLLVFSKYFYLSSLASYYTFYLIDKFHVSVQSAQLHLFVFLGAVAAGTVIGGPIGDRIGRKHVIWWSILGVLPFTLIMPYANLLWTGLLSIVIGLVLSSAFSAILVFATEMVPGRVGTVAGLFFGFAFGTAGVGAAALGALADRTSIEFVYHVCSFLPAIGILTYFLPNIQGAKQAEH